MDSGTCMTYEIRVEGLLDPAWSDWFNGLDVVRVGSDPACTEITGVLDQAALRGLLNKIWDLGLTMISIRSSYDAEG